MILSISSIILLIGIMCLYFSKNNDGLVAIGCICMITSIVLGFLFLGILYPVDVKTQYIVPISVTHGNYNTFVEFTNDNSRLTISSPEIVFYKANTNNVMVKITKKTNSYGFSPDSDTCELILK